MQLISISTDNSLVRVCKDKLSAHACTHIAFGKREASKGECLYVLAEGMHRNLLSGGRFMSKGTLLHLKYSLLARVKSRENEKNEVFELALALALAHI